MRTNIGIDVSSLKLDVYVDGSSYVLKNTQKEIKSFFSHLLSEGKKIFVGYEATGNYSYSLQKVLSDLDIPQIKLNPFRFSHYIKHLNGSTKNDIKDSEAIAHYISSLKEDEFKTKSTPTKDRLNSFNTALNLLTKIETQLKNLIASQRDLPNDDLKEAIDNLRKAVSLTRKNLKDIAYAILQDIIPESKIIEKEIKGVSKDTLLKVLPIIYENKNYTCKQLISYVGLSPRDFSSGSSVRKSPSITKRGNPLFRKAMFLASLISIRFNPVCKEKYQKMVDRGKPKKVAIVANMAFLVRWIRSYFHGKNTALY